MSGLRAAFLLLAVPVGAGAQTPVAYSVERLAEAIGNRKIVLLGENGHGVEEFTVAKVAMVRHLHERLGFQVLAIESGFYECGAAWARDTEPVRSVMLACLLFAFQHAALEPLFEYARFTRGTATPLVIAGIDLQLQGRNSRGRPAFFRRALGPGLGDRVAAVDSALVEVSMLPADSFRAFVRREGAGLRTLYDSAAARTGGDTAWAFRGASALLSRELLRVEALAGGATETPASVLETRDEWMAATVARLAEAAPKGKVIVWLHNDHARYGWWEQGSALVRATGQMLRARFGGEVFSLGFLMGGGSFANNSRREQAVPEPPAGGLERIMAQGEHPVAFLRTEGAWAKAEFEYLRGGSVARMRPVREFDALVYFARVSPAVYLPR